MCLVWKEKLRSFTRQMLSHRYFTRSSTFRGFSFELLLSKTSCNYSKSWRFSRWNYENDLRTTFAEPRFDTLFFLQRFLLTSLSKNKWYDRQKFQQSFAEKGSRGSSTIFLCVLYNRLPVATPPVTSIGSDQFLRVCFFKALKKDRSRSKDENVDVVG